MVFNVRCYKCGENEVRLVLGGRAIIHARCHGCDSNLLAEVMEFEQQVLARGQAESDDSVGDEKPIASLAANTVSETELQASNTA